MLGQCGSLVYSSDSVRLSSHLSVAHFFARRSCVLFFSAVAAPRIEDCVGAGFTICFFTRSRPIRHFPYGLCLSFLSESREYLNTFLENSFARHSFRSAKISIFEKISSDIDSFLTMFQRFFPLLIHYFIKMSVMKADVGVFVHAYCVFLITVDVHYEFGLFHLSDMWVWSDADVSLS